MLAHHGGVLAFTGSGDVDRFRAALLAETGPLPDTLKGRRRYFATWLTQQAPPAGIVPGQDFFYSNAGYALGATMVEALTGESFEALFEAQVVSVLGLRGRWRMPSEVPTELPPLQPAGHEGPKDALEVYLPDAEALETEPWLRVIAPAGYWACAAADYASWLRLHLRALRGQNTPLPPTTCSA